MKKLLIAALISLCACSPTPEFKVGDCIRYEDPRKESWENGIYVIQKIIEIGKKKYRTKVWLFEHWCDNHSSDTYFTTTYAKVECPKESK